MAQVCNGDRPLRVASIVDARAGGSINQRRLLADLHDGLGQELIAISMMLQAKIKNPPATHSALMREVMYLSQLVERAIQTLRDLTRGATGFERLELIEALRRLGRTLSRTTGVIFRVKSRGVTSYSINGLTATHLYRIAQEASANAVKHAGAQQVIIELVVTKRRVRLSIIDNGHGIASRRYADGGLQSMRRRAAAISGALTVEPGKTAGTLVTCAYPRIYDQFPHST
jgi:signal transduction histidine kinase